MAMRAAASPAVGAAGVDASANAIGARSVRARAQRVKRDLTLHSKATPCTVSDVTARAGIRSSTTGMRLRGPLATGFGFKRSLYGPKRSYLAVAS